MQTRTTLEDLVERLRNAQRELEQEVERLLTEKREEFHYTLRRGKVVFERGMRRLQRQQRTGLAQFRQDWDDELSSPVSNRNDTV